MSRVNMIRFFITKCFLFKSQFTTERCFVEAVYGGYIYCFYCCIRLPVMRMNRDGS